MISTRQRFTRSFEATLFGNILSVGRTEILVLIAATGVTVSALLIMYRPLL
ncbi:MAG: metal ABC transporter permease, partial [Acidimicrobiia bacterium]